MKNLTQLSLLLIFFSVNTVFSQTTINDLEGRNWLLSATQFEDSSYVVSCQHSGWPTIVIMLDKNGNQTLSKSHGKKENWTFGERPFNRFGAGLMVPLIDKQNKVCYSLFGKDGKLSVTIINEKLEPEIIFTKEPMYKKFEGLYEYTAPIAVFDSEGNPFWAITQNRMGILLVKYDIEKKSLEHKYLEHEGYSNIVSGYSHISASVIGYYDEKVWFGRITDRGHKKESGTLTLYSIDKSFNVKSEKEIILNKPEDDLLMMVKNVDQFSKGYDETIFFTLHSISANNGGPIKKFWFFKFDGEEVESVSWENNTGSPLPHLTTLTSETDDELQRFVMGDIHGNAIAWNVDFDNSSVDNFSSLVGMAQDDHNKTNITQIDNWIYSMFLFEGLLNRNIMTNIGDYKIQGNTPLIFRNLDNEFFLIKGNYSLENTFFKIQL